MAEDREIRVDEIKRLQRERRQKARRRNILIGIVSLTISVVTLLLVIGLLLCLLYTSKYRRELEEIRDSL